MLLAVDTSEQTCSAALLGAGDAVFQRSETIGRGHAERLLPLIDMVLEEARASYNAIDRIAVTTGPGTFTGLRVGLSVARGIALANKAPCIGISGLQVLARQAQQTLAAPEAPVHAIMTGRAGQAFYQPFCGIGENGAPVPSGTAINADIGDIADIIRQAPGEIVGSGCHMLTGDTFKDLSPFTTEKHLVIDPVVLGMMAQYLDPDDYRPDPLYLRDADAKKAVPMLPVDAAPKNEP